MTGNTSKPGFCDGKKEHHDRKGCEPRTFDDSSYEIRSAICTIEDRAAFLQAIRAIGESYNTHIVCFNADMLAGIRHARTAICHAIRSYNSGTMISNTLEMEALLCAAGSRQCSLAAPFGVHPGENHLHICCYPKCDGVWGALAPFVHLVEDRWNCIDPQKRASLIDLFGITCDELATADGDRIVDLILERVALLEVYR